jgi:hypothetical protein
MGHRRRRTAGPSLRDLFQQRAAHSVFRDRKARFLPRGELDELITKDAILKAFDNEQGEDSVDGLIDFIQERALQVFAILVDIKFESPYEAMLLFQKKNFCDGNLPIDKIPENTQNLLEREVQHMFFDFEREEGNTGDSWWSVSAIGDFYQRQWDFIAPTISTTDHYQAFHEDMVLPFIEKPATFAEGSFGKVTQFRVHPKHIEPVSKPLSARR